MSPRSAARALLAAFVLLRGDPAPGLEIREGFEWDWAPGCLLPGPAGQACFRVAGCPNGRDVFVRRTNAGVCGYHSEVRSWVGGPTGGADGPTPPAGMAVGRWAARHVFDRERSVPRERPNDDTFEILTSRRPQSRPGGSLQVDLRVPRDVPTSGAGEHYLVMHHLSLSPVPGCPPDGPGCSDADRQTSFGGVPGHPDSYRWYGVIAGSFGEQKGLGTGKVGFVVEVSANGSGGTDLVDETFLPYSVDGAGSAFPEGWYRISIRRERTAGDDTYRYDVRRWRGDEGWAPIVPDDGSPPSRSVPFARLTASEEGKELPLGYVGLTAAWFGEFHGGRSPTEHVDWDNLIVDW